MGDFMDDGERAARGWRLAARIAPGAPSPLRAQLPGRALLVFHAGAPGGEEAPDPGLVACVVEERCPQCGASRAQAGAWRAGDAGLVRCPGCAAEEAVGGDEPAWPVMCVDDEVYVYVEDA